MAENFSKSDKNYGLPEIKLVPVDRGQPAVAKTKESKPQEPNSKGQKILPIAMLVVFGLIAASLLYYFFWDTNSSDTQEDSMVANQEDRVTLEEGEGGVTAPVDSSALNTGGSLPVDPGAPIVEEPGSIVTISQRTGRYYIFMGSYKFRAYARRHAERLAADGFAVKLITPDNWVGMRVAVGNYANIAEANTDVEMIRNKYGNEVVVSKY